MSMSIKFSSSYEAKRKRIQRLPKLLKGAVSGATKKDLLRVKEIFEEGIKNNLLGLERLALSTIDSKKRKSYPRPTSPLYGKGDLEGDRSYHKMLYISKTTNGWVLKPSNRKHWSGVMTLKDLFRIHEYGATIMQKRGEKSVLIRIPPRPALLLAYRRHLIRRRKDKKETSQEVKAGITEYINTGNARKLNQLEKWKHKTSIKEG